MTMPPTSSDNLTQMLIQLSEGKSEMIDDILPVIYNELRRIAGGYLRRERSEHTLQPTALVHEAYLKLIDQTQVKWQNRAHFFCIAANIMRRILVDHARRHKASKRGGKEENLSLDDEIIVASESRSSELLALDEALKNLAKVDPQKSKIVELRYFGGLSVEETAEVLGVSEITVKRHWRLAKAWLYGQLSNEN